jgi:predicted transcriptional regulator
MSYAVQDPTITGCKVKADKAKDGYVAKILAGEIKDPPLSTQRKILKELGIGENDGI